MTFQPSISVIVPTYNRIDSLLPVLDAIFNQTYAPAEVIVADDGSSDGTADTLRAKSWPNLKIIELAHSGLPAVARNAAINEAQGEWIAFCDSDDIWVSNKLERQVDSIKKGQGCVITNARFEDSPTTFFFDAMPAKVTLNQLLKRNWVITSSTLVNKNLLLEVGGFPDTVRMNFVEDYAMWLRISALSEISVVNEPLITYRRLSPDSHRAALGSTDVLLNPLAWLDFLAWMHQRGHPLTFSENFINAVLPRTIAAHANMQKKRLTRYTI